VRLSGAGDEGRGVRAAGGHARSEMRRDGIAYTAGVLVSFGAMAAAILAIRASVGEVSWGFQFQSPIFSLLVAYLFFVVGLNLAGVFEIAGGFSGVGQGLASRGGNHRRVLHRRAGGGRRHALHCALHGRGPGLCAQPARAADHRRAAGDGLGLALPYLALSMTPALQRLMPRPGAVDGPAAPVPRLPDVRLGGLDDLGADPADRAGRRDLCAGRHGADRLRDLAAADRQRRLDRHLAAPRRGRPRRAAGLRRRAEARGRAGHRGLRPGGPSTGVSFEGWERFLARAHDRGGRAGKPVFVDFTAAWCITCLVNERVALETPATRRAFEQTGTVKLKGDWTNRDPEITALLKELGRAGVPLYLYWAPGAAQPKICRRC
jgi:thiol:disulfide interchange protein DsbD